MKAVMLSIRPEWCAKIANGEKTVELRKSFPAADKVKTPFKCYIYATKSGNNLVLKGNKVFEISKDIVGKVIGEFMCDALYWAVSHPDTFAGRPCFHRAAIESACITMAQAQDYSKGKNVYGWHISDLVIYDTPKELSEFYVWKKCNSCRKSGYESTACGYDEDCKVPAIITRPPQSWCYVED